MTKHKSIIMYGTPTCDDCIRTKKFFAEHAVAYDFVSIAEDHEAVKIVEKLNNGAHSTPTLVFPDGSVLTEPSNQELAKKLGI